MKHIKIPTNFIYPTILSSDRKFGSTPYPSKPLRQDGDWRSYTPPYELQRKNGIESSACYKEAQQHTIATIQEEKYGLLDQNYSARFNDQENATPSGGSPTNAAQSFRHDGLIPDAMLPFSDEIKSWQDFNSFKGTNEIMCRKAGQDFLKEWDMNWDIVFERDEAVEEKYNKLREALKFSPVPISVNGWVQDDQGVYVKPHGSVDNHFVECIYLDENNCPYILDTYEPFIKKLEPFYNSDFSLRWTIAKKKVEILSQSEPSIWQLILSWLQGLFAQFKRT